MIFLLFILFSFFFLTGANGGKLHVLANSPIPETHVYKIEGAHDNVCIVLQAAIRLKFKINQGSNKSIEEYISIPEVSNITTVTGNCSAPISSLIINYFGDWKTEFIFQQNMLTMAYFMKAINFTYTIKKGQQPFPKAEDIGQKTASLSLGEMNVSKDTSFTCLSHKSYKPLPVPNPYGLLDFEILNLRYQAFVHDKSGSFLETSLRCYDDLMSSTIPMVVGVSLVVLIVLVCVIFLIGHKRKVTYENV